MSGQDAAIAALEGAAAVPRVNGELVFEAPWEGRAFGIAVALYERGAFAWDRFRDALIEQIASAGPDVGYYESWLAALESVLADQSLLAPAEVAHRAAALRAQPR